MQAPCRLSPLCQSWHLPTRPHPFTVTGLAPTSSLAILGFPLQPAGEMSQEMLDFILFTAQDAFQGRSESFTANLSDGRNRGIEGEVEWRWGSWTLDGLRPWIEHVIACFGWDRVVWGSDSPVCTLHSNLVEWVAATQVLLADLSNDERNAVLQGNARRIWQIGAATL